MLKGEIKAVNRTAAENLLEYYGIGLDLRDSNEIIDLTGKNKDDYKLTKLLTGYVFGCIMFFYDDEMGVIF